MTSKNVNRVDDHIKFEVQQANDIVEVIGQYIPLKRSGQNLKACCPFHQEKTPSFMVNPAKQIFHCFGCGVGGDVFSFLMKHDNLNFPEALRILAERAHIRLPEKMVPTGEHSNDQEKIYEIYQIASDYYHAQFLNPAAGKAARDYFYKRGYDEATSREMKMGWAPDVWRGLFDLLIKKGYSESLLLKSALIHRSPKGNFYDVFRGRLLFPIRNLQGKVVAFGGRMMGDKSDGPKYLNSPENPVFYKRKELFGLYLAKKFIDQNRPQIFVVEGYFDWLKLYSRGFKTVAATLGTSLTLEHVQLLKRFAQEAVVIYDGDKAGEAASLRGLEVFLEGGMNVKLVRMPQGYDPDDFLDKQGNDAFKKLLEDAQDFFDYKLEVLLRHHNRWDSLGLMKITGDFLETLVKVKNPVLLDRYLRRLAGSLGIDENSLRTELIKLNKKSLPAAQDASRKFSSAERSKTNRTPSDEEILIYLASDHADYRERIFSEISEEEFLEPHCREAFQKIFALSGQDLKLDWKKILSSIASESLKERMVALVSLEWNQTDKEKALQDCLKKMRKKKMDADLDAIRRNIARAEKEGNQTKVNEFLKAYQSLLEKSKPQHFL